MPLKLKDQFQKAKLGFLNDKLGKDCTQEELESFYKPGYLHLFDEKSSLDKSSKSESKKDQESKEYTKKSTK